MATAAPSSPGLELPRTAPDSTRSHPEHLPAHSRPSMSRCIDGVALEKIAVVHEYEHTRSECDSPPAWLRPISPEFGIGHQGVREVLDELPFADTGVASNSDCVTNFVTDLCVTSCCSHVGIESDSTRVRVHGARPETVCDAFVPAQRTEVQAAQAGRRRRASSRLSTADTCGAPVRSRAHPRGGRIEQDRAPRAQLESKEGCLIAAIDACPGPSREPWELTVPARVHCVGRSRWRRVSRPR